MEIENSEHQPNFLEQRLAKLEQHLNYQIDENRKTSRNYDELKSALEMFYQTDILDIKKRLLIAEDLAWTRVAVVQLSERQNKFESQCREFEKQRFDTIAQQVKGLCETEKMRYGKAYAELKKEPICSRCEGSGRTWK